MIFLKVLQIFLLKKLKTTNSKILAKFTKYEQNFLTELQTLTIKEKNKALETSKVAQQILAASSRVN